MTSKAEQCETVSEGTPELPPGHHETADLQNIMVTFTSEHSHFHWRTQMIGVALLRQAAYQAKFLVY